MKQLFTTLFLFLATLPTIANDGSYFASGNQLIPLQETHISVKKEILTIHLKDDGTAEVDVYYEFYNPGATTKDIRMGFEADIPYNTGDSFNPNGVHPYINNFTVEINGTKTPYRNTVAVNNIEEKGLKPLDPKVWKETNDYEAEYQLKNINTGEFTGYSYVYYFDASFKPGINKIHHTYSYELSVVVGTTWLLNYKLSPAARWANNRIDDFTLIIDAKNTAKHFTISKDIFGQANTFKKKSGECKIRTLPNSAYGESNEWEIAIRNGAVEMHMMNFTPSSENELVISSADTYYSYSAPDNNYHFGAFYDRSSASFIYMAESMSNVVPANKEFRQRICKNLPFAHRGHVFKDQKLRDFFMKQFWYMPDPNYKDDTSNFTKTDKEVMTYKIGSLDR